MSTNKKLIKTQEKAYATIDTYLEAKYKRATTLERIKIRGVQKAINKLLEVERELTLNENM